MAIGLFDLFLFGVGKFWGLAEDFTPKQTVTEFARLVEDLRSELFDAPSQEMHRRLEARQAVVQDAVAVLEQSGASDAIVSIAREESSLMEELLSPPHLHRDVLAGSLSRDLELGPEWWRVKEIPDTASLLGRTARVGITPLFESRELRDEQTQIRAILKARQQILTEVRGMLSPQHQSQVDAKLAALSRVEVAVSNLGSAPDANASTGRT